jgi:hypothetical protein
VAIFDIVDQKKRTGRCAAAARARSDVLDFTRRRAVNFLYMGSFFIFREKGSRPDLSTPTPASSEVHTQNTIGLNFKF